MKMLPSVTACTLMKSENFMETMLFSKFWKMRFICFSQMRKDVGTISLHCLKQTPQQIHLLFSRLKAHLRNNPKVSDHTSSQGSTQLHCFVSMQKCASKTAISSLSGAFTMVHVGQSKKLFFHLGKIHCTVIFQVMLLLNSPFAEDLPGILMTHFMFPFQCVMHHADAIAAVAHSALLIFVLPEQFTNFKVSKLGLLKKENQITSITALWLIQTSSQLNKLTVDCFTPPFLEELLLVIHPAWTLLFASQVIIWQENESKSSLSVSPETKSISRSPSVATGFHSLTPTQWTLPNHSPIHHLCRDISNKPCLMILFFINEWDTLLSSCLNGPSRSVRSLSSHPRYSFHVTQEKNIGHIETQFSLHPSNDPNDL